jgi:RNA polymerase sigma-70 factor (ECF subfamily)
MARSRIFDADPEQEISPSLLEAVARGERAAVQRFVLQVTPRVRRVARRICGPVEGEDATQAALLMIVRGVGELREPTALAFWIDRVTLKTSLSCLRREQRRSALLRRWCSPGQLPWGQQGESFLCETLGLSRPLRALPDSERALLVMRYVLEFSAAEIAELSSAAEGTIRNRLRKSRRRLARSLQRCSQPELIDPGGSKRAPLREGAVCERPRSAA